MSAPNPAAAPERASAPAPSAPGETPAGAPGPSPAPAPAAPRRVALVTGASRGIGRAIAVQLGATGAHVAVNFVSNEPAAAETLAAVRAAGGSGELLPFDVADAAATKTAIDGLVERQGRLDVLVNNAGVAIDGLVMRTPDEALQRLLQVNLAGAFHCCRAAARVMVRQRSGRIVSVSSVVADAGGPGQSAYAASKSGLHGLTRSLARELGSRGITVNAVSPGLVTTDMTDAMPPAAREAVLASTPLGRAGRPEEVAAAVVWLASDAASYVTGHVLSVNGGLHV